MGQVKAFLASRKGKIIFISTFLLVFVASVASAFQPRSFMRKMMRGKINAIAKKVNLTKTQKAKLRKIYKEARKDRAKHKARVKKFRKQIKTIMLQDKPNKKKLDTLIANNMDEMKKVVLSKTTYILQAHAVLTSKQRKILHSEMKKMKSKFKHFRSKWHKKFDDPNHVPFFLK